MLSVVWRMEKCEVLVESVLKGEVFNCCKREKPPPSLLYIYKKWSKVPLIYIQIFNYTLTLQKFYHPPEIFICVIIFSLNS